MPITAWMILLRAAATFSLSPSEIIQSNAPQSIIKTKTTPAKENIKATKLDKNWLIAPAPVGSFAKKPFNGSGGSIFPKV